MSKYIEENESFLKTVKEEFQILNQYNTTIISVGFASFFAMAVFVKDGADKTFFLWAIISMSISISIFVIHELIRSLYYSWYISNKAKAIEKLLDEQIGVRP